MSGKLGASFAESAIFWTYLAAASPIAKIVLTVGNERKTIVDEVWVQFCCVFLVDYIWRRFLTAGNYTDPGAAIIKAVQGKGTSRDICDVTVGCLTGGLVSYLVVSAVLPSTTYVVWQPSKSGVLYCFLVELTCDLVHQMRNASWFLFEESLLASAALERGLADRTAASAGPLDDIPQSASKEISSVGAPQTIKSSGTTLSRRRDFKLVARGVHATASLTTAAIIAMGGLFVTGGPMLNITYTMLAAIYQRDIWMFFILGFANILAPLLAAKYASFDVTLATPDVSQKEALHKTD